ncbi:rRNA maturation RNase YbeY [Adhaeretor mobilis]|uniref:Endoribonuclease YbeY n=1 Tax=Adhaeretor mobilis TaxID=1930276 RepID=A0A517MSJ3_9BACT|nr:rRNA maturation RNase YbeY [Adhaeretor mobilis]QDS97852.1 Endoribonuclease YbeY [Adhaeretor mobilis]
MKQHAAPSTTAASVDTIASTEQENAPLDDSEPPEPSAIRSQQYSIAIANEQASACIGEQGIKDAVTEVLADSNTASAAISVAIVDDATMRPLNKQFLEHDYTTDVLSFALNDPNEPLQGELIVNAQFAEREALEAGWEATNELLLYVVHGMLHLVGHCDKSPDDAAIMKQAECRVLDALGVQRSKTDARWLVASESKKSKRNSTDSLTGISITQRGAQK